MNKFFRFSPSRFALICIALSVVVLALFAIPLWYAWQVNISTFRTYVLAESTQTMAALFDREGARGLAVEIESKVKSLPGDEVLLLADPSKLRIAGNLPAWPAAVPDSPGTYGLVMDMDGSSMRMVVSHVILPGGYHLLMGRESARFQSLVHLYWYGIAGATAIVLILGAAVGWLIRRALLADVHEISRDAAAIVEGDLTRRLATRGGSQELETLAQTVNGMLEKLARQNVQLEREIADRQETEQALHRTHSDLERLIEQRTAQLARANASLEGEKRLLEVIAKCNPLPAILDAVCRHVEEVSPGVLCSIMLLDAGSGQMRHGAAPSLPPGYVAAIDNWPVTDGPCGLAASRGQRVIASDIATDDRWEAYKALAAAHGIRACWSTPIVSSGGKVLGTFAMLSREPGSPTPQHQNTIEQVTHIASIALERKRVDEELRALERQLRQSHRLEAMGTLAGGIAHDFNNILGAILGYGEMALRDAPKGGRLRRDLDSIMSAGERGRALIERVLAFSRSGVVDRVAVHVQAVVREALDLIAATLPHGIHIEARLFADGAAMRGDTTQVHQVVMNLATNAIQAMPAGGVLRVSLEEMRLGAPRASTIGTAAAGDYLVLQVADEGGGIPPGILDRIFDPFFTTKEVGVGTGLGLSLVHGIVSDVGGSIDVASTPGQGTVFTVYLPRAGEVPAERANDAPVVPRGNQQRVLVVDDEEPLVTLTAETLKELGYAPVGYTSSLAALAAFRASPGEFDAVITDERMPGMSGSAFVQEVRSIRRSIPILLVSGYLGGAVASRAYNLGASEVLKKPLLARELAASLARVLHPQ